MTNFSHFSLSDHFVYNTNYGTNDDTTNNGGLNSAETQNYGTSTDDSSVSDHSGGPYQWEQQDYTTRRNTRKTTTATTTTTSIPYLVYEDSFNSQRPIVRPTTRSTRTTTTRTTPRTTTHHSASNYWPNTSQQHGSINHHRPSSYDDNIGATSTQQRPYNTGDDNYGYTDEIPSTQQQHHGTSQFGQQSTNAHQQPHHTQSQDNNQYHPTQQHYPGNNPNNNHQNGGIPFSQPDASQFGLNQPEQDNYNSHTQSQFGNDQSQSRPDNQFTQQGNTQTNRPNNNCRRSITTVNKKRIPCKNTVIFEEQFDYNFESRWSQDVRMPLEDEVIRNESFFIFLVGVLNFFSFFSIAGCRIRCL